MASYKIEWKPSATKELRKLDKPTVQNILQAIQALADNPFPPGGRKLVGSEQAYRIRTGNYRVIYTVRSSTLIIEIVKVGHRRNIYRRLN